MGTHYWESRQSMTPQKALDFLREGNNRFINNLGVNRNHLQLMNETAEKQFPFSTILSCSDSRVCAGLIFEKSSIIRTMINNGDVGICGAIYDVETGKVEFIEYNHQKQTIHEKFTVKA